MTPRDTFEENLSSELISKFRISRQPRTRLFRYGVSVFSVMLSTAACWFLLIKSNLPSTPFILYYPAVVFSAWYGGVGPGLFATSFGSLMGAFFISLPSYSLRNMEVGDFLQLILFVFLSLTICLLMGNLHKSLSDNLQMNKDLLRSQRRTKNILESIQGCFFSLDRGDSFTHINEDCKDYLPLAPKNFYGKSLWDAFPHWKGTEFESQLRQVAQSSSAVEFKFYDALKNKWFEIHIGPSTDGASVHLFDITAREEAEIAVGESESRFRIMADQAPVLIWMSGIDTFCNYFNEPWLKYRGRTMEQETGEGWLEGVHPDDRSEYLKAYLIAFNTRQKFQIEYRLLRADGQYRWMLAAGVPRLIGDKRFAGYIGSVVDITDRRQEEKRQTTEFKIIQIMAQEISLSQAFLEILKVICEELDWEIGFYWELKKNPAQLQCKQIYSKNRFPAEEFIEKNRQSILEPGVGLVGRILTAGRPYWLKDLAENLSQGEAGFRSSFGFPIRFGVENFGVMQFFNPQIQEEDPQLLRLFDSIGILIGQFIERKEAEEALLQSQQNFNLALESARMGYWSWDLKSDRVNWSENLAFLHGLSTETLSGTFDSLLSHLAVEDRELAKKNVMEAIQKKSIYKLDFRTRWADGTTHWIHGRGHVLCDKDGSPAQLIGLEIDITERKQSEKIMEMAYQQMEKMVEERTAQLARTNQTLNAEIVERRKVEKEILEISQKEQRRWGAQIHDDLCQNLTGITLLLNALAQNYERKKILDRNELKRIQALLEESIIQAKEMARGLYPVELEADSLMLSLKDLTRRTEAIFKVPCLFHCPKPILIEDNNLATHLYRITQEAIHNAIKHGEAERVDVRLLQEGHQMTLTIEDDGKGVSEENRNFSGIGFQIMKYRARMIEGNLEIKPKPPYGTILTCSFTYPLADNLSESKIPSKTDVPQTHSDL